MRKERNLVMSTIVSISTAPGIGGIGIIRMSGEETFNIIEKKTMKQMNDDMEFMTNNDCYKTINVEHNKI